MLGETLNAPAPVVRPAPVARTLPRRLLYSIFARVGGSGLDTDAFETLRASYRGGFLGKAIAYDNRQKEIPSSLIHSLRWHPVRLISFIDRPYYYGAKKKYLVLLERKRFIREYELADLLLVLSEKAAKTFRVRGFPEEKLFYLPRGVDVERFKPGARPAKFRAVFAGALIKRKGIQHVLEAWHRLNLPDAELWLIGFVHDEAKPFLNQFWRDNIRVVGFVR